MDGGTVTVGDLLRNPKHLDETLGCIVLLHKRSDQEPLLPEESVELQAGDELLFCGRFRAADWMEWTLKNENVLRTVLAANGSPPPHPARA